MDDKDQLKILDTNNSKNSLKMLLSNYVKGYFFDKKKKINILEAGCGRAWNLDLNGINYLLTGLDISKEALQIRKYKKQDLDQMIIGDLCTIELKNAEYDLIYCKYVLEHINGASEVLDKFFRWLKPNGLLVLLIPERNSLRGLATRLTPLWLHYFYYKYIIKFPNAGQPGCGPFPTFYDKVVSKQGIRDYCLRCGYKIRIEYGTRLNTKKIFGICSQIFEMLFKLVEVLSFGNISVNPNDLIYIIQKSK